VSGKSYVLLKRIEDLIARGTKVSDVSAGTPSAQIHDWVDRADSCLRLLEDDPTSLSDFRRIRQSFEFKVDVDEEAFSASAYRPEGADVLLDFSFEHLRRANNILKFAATKLKLEIEGHSLSSEIPYERLGKELRAARVLAGHSQRVAAEKIGYDHKTICEWERGKRKPQPKAVKYILDYINKYPKPN